MPVASTGGTQVPGVVAGGALDLDDVGAEVGEHHRRVRAGEHPGEVGHPDAGQRAGCSVIGGHPFIMPARRTARSRRARRAVGNNGEVDDAQQGWQHAYSGKVRDLYTSPSQPGRMLVVASDRVSAFDHVLEPGIPGKGALLTKLSLWWFDQLAGVPNHLVADAARHRSRPSSPSAPCWSPRSTCSRSSAWCAAT